MFCKQFLSYAVHIDWCYYSINKQESMSYMTTSGMHRRLVVPSKPISFYFLWQNTIFSVIFSSAPSIITSQESFAELFKSMNRCHEISF